MRRDVRGLITWEPFGYSAVGWSEVFCSVCVASRCTVQSLLRQRPPFGEEHRQMAGVNGQTILLSIRFRRPATQGEKPCNI
jgi:hypothetical protein